MKNKVIVVVGPTAVGKTALGIQLAQRFDGEIISGDSQQVYRQISIGTAKATAEEQNQAVHHLIDVRDLTENYSAYDFVTAANKQITEITKRGKIPIIVGGTGLYIQSLVDGYHLGGQENHDEMQNYREELSNLTDEELIEKTQHINIREPNRRRRIRALELEKFATADENEKPEDEFLLIGLMTERDKLYKRINKRVDLMTKIGLLDEAKMLYEDFHDVQAAKAIGYKEFYPYFDGQISLDEAIELVKRNSRRYAKRQLTWFRNRMNVEFFDVFDDNYPENVIKKTQMFLKGNENER